MVTDLNQSRRGGPGSGCQAFDARMKGDHNMKCTLMNLVFAVLTIGCSKEMSWEAPSAGLITRNTAALFYIVPDNTPGVVWFFWV